MNFLVAYSLLWSLNAFAEGLPENSQTAPTVYRLQENVQDNSNVAAVDDVVKARGGFIGRQALAQSINLFADDDGDDNVDPAISGENADERKGVEHNGYIRKFVKEVSDSKLSPSSDLFF